MKKKIIIALGVLLVVSQFFRIDKVKPTYEVENDFMLITNPPEEIKVVMQSACYDCHSYESKYPWYTNVAPVSWWIKHHINEGREELNFSVWETYSEKRKKHKLEEFVEMIEEGEMPLKSYTWGHPEAKLNEQQKEQLITWVKSL